MNLQLARPDGVPDVAPAGAKDVFDAAMEALKARFPLRNPRMQEAADALENGRRDVAEDVYFKLPPPVFGRYKFHRPGNGDAGVVDQAGQFDICEAFERRGNRIGISDVELNTS